MSFKLMLLMVALPAQLAVAPKEKPVDAGDEELRKEVTVAAGTFVGRCEFQAAGDSDASWTLHPEPILRWSNPTAGKVFGEVFVWTDQGRPQVVASWYRWFSPNWGSTLEVCSLAEGPATGQLDDVRFWKTEKPGMTLQSVPDADSPAKSPSTRLVQMRRMAGDFVANLEDTRGNVAGVKRQLRLLTHPVFRYPAATAASTYVDGALFAFVEGTDPEAFLMLEAATPQDGSDWRYGLVRMNRDALHIAYRDRVVWTAPYLEDLENRSNEPYAIFSQLHDLKAAADRRHAAPNSKEKP